jgi:hypothetical protein
MIRRDYLMRQVQELAQVLTRALFLRSQREYEAALNEIRRALKALDPDTDIEELDVQGWLDLCRQHEDIIGPMMEVVGSLLRERAASLHAAGHSPESGRARVAGLTLHLEAILTGSVPVTTELLGQVDADIRALPVQALPPPTLSRLLNYFEQRGQLAAAEDILFDWLDRGDANAIATGRAFYSRLAQMTDDELVSGGLSRAEIEDGRTDLEERAGRIQSSGAGRVSG